MPTASSSATCGPGSRSWPVCYLPASATPAADHVLLFLPNETISAFLFEHDPSVIEDVLRQRIVLCTPISLFTHLALIRQAFDSFMVEETSDEILALLGRFG